MASGARLSSPGHVVKESLFQISGLPEDTGQSLRGLTIDPYSYRQDKAGLKIREDEWV
jgi:hypothetical protein